MTTFTSIKKFLINNETTKHLSWKDNKQKAVIETIQNIFNQITINNTKVDNNSSITNKDIEKNKFKNEIQYTLLDALENLQQHMNAGGKDISNIKKSIEKIFGNEVAERIIKNLEIIVTHKNTDGFWNNSNTKTNWFGNKYDNKTKTHEIFREFLINDFKFSSLKGISLSKMASYDDSDKFAIEDQKNAGAAIMDYMSTLFKIEDNSEFNKQILNDFLLVFNDVDKINSTSDQQATNVTNVYNKLINLVKDGNNKDDKMHILFLTNLKKFHSHKSNKNYKIISDKFISLLTEFANKPKSHKDFKHLFLNFCDTQLDLSCIKYFGGADRYGFMTNFGVLNLGEKYHFAQITGIWEKGLLKSGKITFPKNNTSFNCYVESKRNNSRYNYTLSITRNNKEECSTFKIGTLSEVLTIITSTVNDEIAAKNLLITSALDKLKKSQMNKAKDALGALKPKLVKFPRSSPVMVAHYSSIQLASPSKEKYKQSNQNIALAMLFDDKLSAFRDVPYVDIEITKEVFNLIKEQYIQKLMQAHDNSAVSENAPIEQIKNFTYNIDSEKIIVRIFPAYSKQSKKIGYSQSGDAAMQIIDPNSNIVRSFVFDAPSIIFNNYKKTIKGCETFFKIFSTEYDNCSENQNPNRDYDKGDDIKLARHAMLMQIFQFCGNYDLLNDHNKEENTVLNMIQRCPHSSVETSKDGEYYRICISGDANVMLVNSTTKEFTLLSAGQVVGGIQNDENTYIKQFQSLYSTSNWKIDTDEEIQKITQLSKKYLDAEKLYSSPSGGFNGKELTIKKVLLKDYKIIILSDGITDNIKSFERYLFNLEAYKELTENQMNAIITIMGNTNKPDDCAFIFHEKAALLPDATKNVVELESTLKLKPLESSKDGDGNNAAIVAFMKAIEKLAEEEIRNENSSLEEKEKITIKKHVPEELHKISSKPILLENPKTPHVLVEESIQIKQDSSVEGDEKRSVKEDILNIMQENFFVYATKLAQIGDNAELNNHGPMWISVNNLLSAIKKISNNHSGITVVQEDNGKTVIKIENKPFAKVSFAYSSADCAGEIDSIKSDNNDELLHIVLVGTKVAEQKLQLTKFIGHAMLIVKLPFSKEIHIIDPKGKFGTFNGAIGHHPTPQHPKYCKIPVINANWQSIASTDCVRHTTIIAMNLFMSALAMKKENSKDFLQPETGFWAWGKKQFRGSEVKYFVTKYTELGAYAKKGFKPNSHTIEDDEEYRKNWFKDKAVTWLQASTEQIIVRLANYLITNINIPDIAS